MSSDRASDRDIAIVGIGCRFPKADDTHGFWTNILEGRACFSEVPRDRWDHRVFYSSSQRDVDKAWIDRGAFMDDIKSFAALHYGLAPRRLEVTDPQHRLLIEATRVAIQDAGYERRSFERNRTGVFTGISVSEYKSLMLTRLRAMQMVSGEFGPAAGSPELKDLVMELTRHLVPLRAFSMPGVITNMAAAAVSQTFDFGGPSFTIDAACASSGVAVYDAVTHLRARQVDVAIAGGVYVNVAPDPMIGFTRIGAISPSGVCRPFDARADGFVLGEGVGVLFMKRLADAMRDGDRIHAVIKGGACNNDGRSDGPMTPRVEGQLDVLRSAYRDAELSPTTVSYFEAHGTATKVGDPAEVEAVGRLLTEAGIDATRRPKIGSVKGNIGHTMSAAGVAGLIKTVELLRHRTAPPQAGFESVNPALGIDRWPLEVSARATELDAAPGAPLRGAVSSFGFGGTNAHFILEESPDRPARRRASKTAEQPLPEAVIVTAPNPEMLAAHLRAIASALGSTRAGDATLPQIAYTLNATRRYERFRAVLVARDEGDLVAQLEAAARAVESSPPPVPGAPLRASARVTVFDAGENENAPPPKVAFLFPGQGAQQVGLLRGIRDRFPAYSKHLAALEDSCRDITPRPLSSYVYPPAPLGDGAERLAAEEALKATEICQPAMAAVSLALSALLEDLGIRADVTLGHSLGEFAAVAAAGALEPAKAVRLVALRGAAMAALPLEDTGAMAAAMADASRVEDAIRGIDGVAVANINHPRQVSVSGTSPAVAEAVRRMTASGIEAKPLPVSHAFHSPLLEGVRPIMERLLAELPIEEPSAVAASCILEEPHTGPESLREMMLEHATAKVDFVRALQQAKEAGATIFVQIGAGSVLVSFARATLGREGIETITLAPFEDDRGLELVRGVATLAALGVPVRMEGLTAAPDRRVVDLPETPLERQSYWLIKSEQQPLPRLARETAPGAFGAVNLPDTPTREGDRMSTNQDGPRGGSSSRDKLIELLSKQAEIIQTHASILAAHSRLLLGEGAAADVESAPPAQEITALLRPTLDARPPRREAGSLVVDGSIAPLAPAAAPPVAPSATARDRVLEILAKVSAFPKSSLRDDQRLVDDLGFDSLMVADLAKAIETSFPKLGALPRGLFSATTTVAEIADHVARAESGSGSEARTIPPAPRPAAADAVMPAELHPAPKLEAPRPPALVSYRVAPVARPVIAPNSHSVFGETWLVTDAASPLALLLIARLEERGASVLRVELSSATEEAPASLEIGELNRWPRSKADALAARIARSAIVLDGVIFLDSLSKKEKETDAITTLHALASTIRAPRFFTVTALGGRLGLEPDPALAANLRHAAVLGYTKSLARERFDDVIRALDVDPKGSAAHNAAWIAGEITSGDLEPEAGMKDGRRVVAELIAEEPQTREAAQIGADDVVLLSGGAGDIASRLAADLAVRRRPKAIILVGRRAADAKIADLLARVERSGTRAVYTSADVTDRAALERALAAVVAETGPITVAIHSAGAIEDAVVEKKSDASFQRVLGVKVRGAESLLGALPNLRLLVLFSSWAGRFGNAGQADYAAGNEVLDRLAITGAGGARVLSIDWPPWDGTAMASSIPAIVQEAMKAEGVPFIDPRSGFDAFMALVDGGAVGLRLIGPPGLPARRVRARRQELLSTETHPLLDDHRLRGRPVLPLASAIDRMAELASTAAEGQPVTLEGLALVRGVEVSEPTRIRVRAEGKAGEPLAIELAFQSSAPAGPGGRAWSVAYRAKARVTASDERAPSIDLGGPDQPLPLSLEEFYASTTFHGPRLQGIERIERMTDRGIAGWVRPSRVSDLETAAKNDAWTIDPLVVDSSFQLAAYWAWTHRQKAGVPVWFARFVQLRPFADRLVRCVVSLDGASGDSFLGSIRYEDDTGALYGWIEKIEGRFFADDGLRAPAAANGNGNGHSAHSVEVPREAWDISSFPEVEALDQRLQMTELIGLKNPYFALHAGTARDTSVVDGVEMINYSSYNYLGFSGHPEVVKAAQEAAERYGTSVSASRIASGERPLHTELEGGLARHLGVEDAIVYVSGHATNVTTVGHLFSKDDLIIHDSLIHDSLLQGVRLSGAQRRPYPHGDLGALDKTLKQLRAHYRRTLILAEGVYSMDGDICDLPRLIEIKKRYKCLLLVDEAHSIGVLGPSGRGVGHHFPGVNPRDVDMWMGTLSKSFASCGGYIAGTKPLVRYLKYTAPGFVYSVGISPTNAAAALKSLELMVRHPEIVERLRQRSKLFLEVAKSKGIDTGLAVGAAVVPAIVGNSLDCIKLSAALARRRINVQPIVYPAVEDNSSRLRFFLSATHTEEQIRHTIDVLADELAAIRRESAASGATASL